MPAFKYGKPIFFGPTKDDLIIGGEDQPTDQQVRKEMSEIALQEINGGEMGGYQNEATLRGNGMKEEFGNGVATQILIYNASGYRLNLQAAFTHSGKWSNYTAPDFIEVGEWAVCFHQKRAGAAVGSEGFIVFNLVGAKDGLLIRWSTPFTGSNAAKTSFGHPALLYGSNLSGNFRGNRSGITHSEGLKSQHRITGDSSSVLTVTITNE